MPMSLEELPVGATARVVRLEGGFGFRQNVQDLGLGVGQTLRKAQHGGSGPVLIEFGGHTVAVGRASPAGSSWKRVPMRGSP